MGYGCDKPDSLEPLFNFGHGFGSLSQFPCAHEPPPPPRAKQRPALTSIPSYSIKKPKTNRYPSLKGVDPKFRRNHRHALHGTAKALKERKEGKREVA
ncbi:hypothetical protein PEBR_22989 [Penicillium brasilianum]|uniref:60S ribosomal protein L29 n=1 Tax=Penicillium brasilianum TaxID=104259 RepID=A0A1S9RKJ6_PENBI|nr:hypothetical protein PEBR_22989 [Penicillium brasilianum]